jgi:hypothetical protein
VSDGDRVISNVQHLSYAVLEAEEVSDGDRVKKRKRADGNFPPALKVVTVAD